MTSCLRRQSFRRRNLVQMTHQELAAIERGRNLIAYVYDCVLSSSHRSCMKILWWPRLPAGYIAGVHACRSTSAIGYIPCLNKASVVTRLPRRCYPLAPRWISLYIYYRAVAVTNSRCHLVSHWVPYSRRRFVDVTALTALQWLCNSVTAPFPITLRGLRDYSQSHTARFQMPFSQHILDRYLLTSLTVGTARSQPLVITATCCWPTTLLYSKFWITLYYIYYIFEQFV